MTVSRYRYDKVEQKMIPLQEWLEKYGKRTNRACHIMPDIQPYKAMDKDGTWITSRAQHREYLRANNLIEVGNEKDYMTRNGGMIDDNPNLISERKHEEQVCRSLMKNLEQLKNR